MSGMHMLPVYYTTTNHKKRRKKKLTKRMEAALVEHEKFLKRMGVDPNYKRTPTPLKTEQASVKLPEKNISDYDWSPCLKGKKSTLTKAYTVNADESSSCLLSFIWVYQCGVGCDCI